MATWDEVATQTIPGELPADTEHHDATCGPIDPSSLEPLSPASSSQRPKRYVCSECNKAYTRPSKLGEHMRTHTGERPFACQFPGCTKRYMRNGHLQVHSSTHVPSSQHTCTVPGFAKRSQLHTHMCSHTGENPHVCTVPECNMSFKYPSQLKRHHRTHSEEIKYTCAHTGCMQVFAKWSQLQSHRVVHKPTSHVCHVCGNEFARRHALTVHLLRHDPDRTVFACEHDGCSRFYIDENALRAHVRVVHSGKPRYECAECSKSYAYARSLRDHIKREHGDLITNEGVEDRDGGRLKKRRRTREPTEMEVASGMA
ncbi:Strongly-conserved Zn-finger binding protein (TFIIIA), partial [Coemansia sp. RSA 678]